MRWQSDYLPLRCSRLRREALQEAKPNTTRQRSQMSRSSICPVVARCVRFQCHEAFGIVQWSCPLGTGLHAIKWAACWPSVLADCVAALYPAIRLLVRLTLPSGSHSLDYRWSRHPVNRSGRQHRKDFEEEYRCLCRCADRPRRTGEDMDHAHHKSTSLTLRRGVGGTSGP